MYLANFYIYIAILFLSFIASLNIYAQSARPIYLKLFPVFLLLTLTVEIASYTIAQRGDDNSFIYHLFFPLEFTFYLFVAYNLLSSSRLKTAIVISAFIYLIAIVVYYSIATVEKFPTLAYCGGACLVILFYVFYLFEIVKLPIHLTPKREEGFWIFVGVLLYYSATLPIWICIRFMDSFSNNTLNYFSTLLMIMNYTLYVSFIVAFMCKSLFKKKDESLYNVSELVEYLKKHK